MCLITQIAFCISTSYNSSLSVQVVIPDYSWLQRALKLITNTVMLFASNYHQSHTVCNNESTGQWPWIQFPVTTSVLALFIEFSV